MSHPVEPGKLYTVPTKVVWYARRAPTYNAEIVFPMEGGTIFMVIERKYVLHYTWIHLLADERSGWVAIHNFAGPFSQLKK